MQRDDHGDAVVLLMSRRVSITMRADSGSSEAMVHRPESPSPAASARGQSPHVLLSAGEGGNALMGKMHHANRVSACNARCFCSPVNQLKQVARTACCRARQSARSPVRSGVHQVELLEDVAGVGAAFADIRARRPSRWTVRPSSSIWLPAIYRR